MKKLFSVKTGVVIFSILAALFWLLTAFVKIAEIDQTLIGLDVNPTTMFNTAMSSASRWNSLAACCACLAALFQAADSALK